MSGPPADPATLAAALQHFEAERFAEAEAACRIILERAPHDFWTLRLLGSVYSKQGAPEQAAQLFRVALVSAPPDEPAVLGVMNELATALLAQREHAAALELYRLALKRKPDDATTRHNYGSALVLLNRHAQALEQFRAARAVGPPSAELRLNEGAALMALGDWPACWHLFEERLSLPEHFPQDQFAQGLPRWDGDTDIRGKTILLQAEQGLGDTLQFVRYAPLVRERGARTVLRVPPLLGKLLEEWPGADTVCTFYAEPGGIDMQCLLMSLPSIFGTTVDSVPSNGPYIQARHEYLMLWAALLGARKRPRIGIVWSGKQHLPLRSIPLATLAPLFARSDLEFHCLQRDVLDADRAWLDANPVLVDHSADLKDFADTAALASLMDLVISIDTSMAHLAGALGRPVWIMVPFSADARWMIDRSDTPWYPTARLFRQQQLGDWHGVVARVGAALAHLSGGKDAP
jgi:tetratricopeptide (TPR) repeat protein